MRRERVVIDTNCIVSRLLVPQSVAAHAVRKAIDTAEVLMSDATLGELADVLSRGKFDRYISIEDRQQFFRRLARVVEVVPITHTVRVCRDPKDDKFLEVAVNGAADLIITGDEDLLVLNPYRDVRITKPAQYEAPHE